MQKTIYKNITIGNYQSREIAICKKVIDYLMACRYDLYEVMLTLQMNLGTIGEIITYTTCLHEDCGQEIDLKYHKSALLVNIVQSANNY